MRPEIEKYLTQAAALDDDHNIFEMRKFLVLLSSLVLGIIIWSYLAQVSETTKADGEIITFNRPYQIQFLNGGTVENIHVRNGDMVASGDLLIELDTSTVTTELNRLNASRADLLLTLERLNALLENRDADFQPYLIPYPTLANSQRAHFLQQKQARTQLLQSFERQQQNRKIQLVSKNRQLEAATEEYELINQGSQSQASLAERGFSSKIAALDAAAVRAAAKNQLERIRSEVKALDHSIIELKQKSAEEESRWQEQIKAEANITQAQLVLVELEINQQQARLKKFNLRSPIDGIIKGFNVTGTRQVVGSGEILMEIIPDQEQLLAEVKVLPQDIGFVKPGMQADVKISAFEYQKFGSVPGVVKDISASTYLDNQGRPFFLVTLALSKDFVGQMKTHRIQPGMVVRADIISSKNSVLAYVFRPIQKGFAGAFSER